MLIVIYNSKSDYKPVYEFLKNEQFNTNNLRLVQNIPWLWTRISHVKFDTE